MPMRFRILLAALSLGLVIAVAPCVTGCETIASYFLYNWLQDEFGNGNNTDKESPVIEKILADKQEVHIGDSVVLEVQATDNKDSSAELDYLWFASRGTMASPTSRITVWQAPSTSGKVTITVIVEDSDGNQDSQTVEIDVLT